MFEIRERLSQLESANDLAFHNDLETREAFETRLGQIAALKALISGTDPETIIRKSQQIIARYPGIPHLYRAMIALAQEYQ